MIKNLLNKKEDKTDSNNDEEVQKLRKKFNDIVNSPTEDQQNKQNNTQQPMNSTQNTPMNNIQNNPNQFKYVDPEKAEENERITNLIMQQIKELIEIDNNLNDKNKELENKVSENSNTLSTTKEIVEQFNFRLELIEKNMEKFMGLYEVVTNRFNPFVSEEDTPVQQNQTMNNNNSNDNNTQSNQQTINEPIKQKDDAITTQNNPDIEEKQTKHAPEKNIENPIKEESFADSQKTNDIQIQEEINDIIHDSGIDSKLDEEKQAIIKNELNQAIESAGEKAKTKIAKDELTKHTTEIVSEKLKKEIEKHIKVSNDELKNSMKEMLIETIKTLKEPAKSSNEQTQTNETQVKDTNQQQPEQNQTPDQTSNQNQAPNKEINQTTNQNTNQQQNQTKPVNEQATQNQTEHEKEVHPDYHFNLSDGTSIKNIQELKDSLNTMDDDSFNEHVNNEKNDFAEWIRIVYHNEELANKLSNEKTREGIKQILNSI